MSVHSKVVGLATPDDIRRHIGYKLLANELRAEVAERMLAALHDNPSLDYATLLRMATFVDPPATVYHTAPVSARSDITWGGLTVCQPGRGGSWAPSKAICVLLQAEQPPGVYVTAAPDHRGVWSHWAVWDIWEIRRGDLPWAHDMLNPGCWRIDAPVPPTFIRLRERSVL